MDVLGRGTVQYNFYYCSRQLKDTPKIIEQTGGGKYLEVQERLVLVVCKFESLNFE